MIIVSVSGRAIKIRFRFSTFFKEGDNKLIWIVKIAGLNKKILIIAGTESLQNMILSART